MENNIIEILENRNILNNNYKASFNILGIDSITFLNIVIETCKNLNVDFMKLSNTNLSTESTPEEYISTFLNIIQE
jgi:acyl carrier protein